MSAALTEAIAPPVRFRNGDQVRVRADWPEAFARCHIRTPSYARGHVGEVIRCFGAYKNPEDLAFGRPASLNNLYHVAFRRQTLWPDEASGNDVLLIELYEHWLSPATGAAADDTNREPAEK